MLFVRVPQAAGNGFAPALLQSEGELEIGLSHEKDENTLNGRGVKTEDLTAVERIRINTIGYVYHPRFLLFTVGGALGLLEEDYHSSSGLTRRGTRGAHEYNIRGILLPEHPYNLEVFTLRQSPFIKPRYSFIRPVVVSSGALFKYKQKPFTLQLGVTDTETSSNFTTNTRSYRSNGGFSVGPFFNGAGYDYSRSTNSFLMQTTRNDTFFSNDLSLPNLNLASQVRKDRMKQEDPRFAPVRDDILTWTEQLNAQFPWNFSGTAGYNLMKDTRTTEQTPYSAENVLFNDTRSAYGSLSSRVYRSLWTTYTKNYSAVDTSSGESRTWADSLASTYTKSIPTGKFTAGISVSRADSDINNRPFILDEVHRVTFLGDNPFTLNGRSVDELTLRVWVEDPATAVLLPLTSSSYLVQAVGTTLQVFILSATLPFPVTPGTPYRFHVSYSLLPVNVQFRTDYSSYTLSFDLFEARVKPYASYSSSAQEVLAGSLPGGPDTSRAETLGLILQQNPYMAQTEFASVTSLINPYRTWKNVFEYRDQITPATLVGSRLSLIRSSYPQALSGLAVTGYIETVKILELNLQHRVPRKNLDLVLGTSFTRRTSFVTAKAYSLNSALVWQIGKLTVNAGVLLSDITTVFWTGKENLTTEYYYATVSRKIF